MNKPSRSVSLGPYNETVRACFKNPAHGGSDDSTAAGQRYESRISEPGDGTQIVLTAVVDQTEMHSLRFRVFGCPHLIAAAEVTCEHFEGGPVQRLEQFDVQGLMENLGVPIEKMGRILLLEDAIRLLLADMGKRIIDED